MSVVDEQGRPIENVAVYAMPAHGAGEHGAAGTAAAHAAAPTPSWISKNLQFMPHLLVVQSGALVTFPNGDDVSHHVYSFSETKSFELALYKGNVYPPVLFDRPGIVVLGCNIHDGMLGYVVVVDTPHFARTNEQGVALIDGVPNGDYAVTVWTPRVRPASLPPAQHMTVTEQGTVAAEIRIGGRLAPAHQHARFEPDVGPLLTRARPAALLAATLAAAPAAAQSDRHEFYFDASAGYVSASTDLRAWTEGGFSKLRYAEDGFEAFRLFGEYHGRITPTLRARVVVDYVDDASDGLGVTEAVIDWRPIPQSRNQHQLRFGAFYPSFSLENGDRGWESPFTYSYSAINTWIGEEIRPIGAEWSLRRRLEGFRSNHELRAFASGFYGNDPAGTLLFWRGWALHDRQTRLGDELDIPPMPFTTNPQRLSPIAETDHRPGAYAGLEWRYAQRALVQVARYDNRADPYSFSDGQWGWGTDFNHLARAGQPARRGRSRRAVDGRRHGVAHGRAAERDAAADLGVRARRIRVQVRDADAQARSHAAASRCATTRSRPSGRPTCPCSTATRATPGR